MVLMRFFAVSILSLIGLASCNLNYFFMSQRNFKRSTVPGLTLTLPSRTSRNVLSAITSTTTLVDSNTFAAAGTSPWVSNASAPRIGEPIKPS